MGLTIGSVRQPKRFRGFWLPQLDAVGDSVKNWAADFSPAISPSSAREPEWFVLRYVTGKEKLLLRLLNYVELPYQHLVYKQPVARSKPVDRSWLPGYMFLSFDLRRDNWGQVLRMPAALEVLGGPTPLPIGLVDDLVARLPSRLAKPSALSCVAPGVRVRVRKGAFEGHEATVTWSDRKRLKVILMLFGRPTDVELAFSDVEIV